MEGRTTDAPPGRRVAFLSYHFPPLAGIASERAAAFARHLPAHGWEPVVLAPETGHFHRTAEEPLPECRIVRIRNPELSRLFRRGWMSGSEDEPSGRCGELTPVPAGTLGGALRALVREVVYVPDAQVAWIPFARNAVLRVLAESPNPSVIHSSSVPYSAHLAAGLAARKSGVPWVAELRDPWTVHEEAFLPRTSVRRNVDRRLEEWVLRVADELVVTSEGTRELYLSSFAFLDPDRVTVIRNGFEPLAPGGPPGPDEPLRLVHAGTLHDPEYARPMVEALVRIHDRFPGAVELLALGDPSPWRGPLASMGIPDLPSWLALEGIVSPARAREVMIDASALLLMLPDPRFARVISAKLTAYLGARRPILGAIPPGSEMGELVDRFGEAHWVGPWTARGAEDALLRLLRRHRSGQLQTPVGDETRLHPLTREATTGALARVLERALGGVSG